MLLCTKRFSTSVPQGRDQGNTMQSKSDIRNASASLKDALASRGQLSCIWFSLGSPALVEIALHSHPDVVVIDRQHGLWGRSTLESVIGVARHQVPVIVRCVDNSAQSISEALDAGAASVLIPLVESAEQASRAVSSGRYPPVGTRSGGGVRPLLGGFESMKNDAERIAVGVMIETVAGVEHVESIAATPGLDYLFIGTGDLALSRGDAAAKQLGLDCARVLAAAHAQGLPCGIFTVSAADAVQQLANGFDMVVCANDIETARSGFEAANTALRERVRTAPKSL